MRRARYAADHQHRFFVLGDGWIMENKKSILLRIDPVLWNDLNRWAHDDLRSLNGQIEWLLRQAVRKRKGRMRDYDAKVD